MNKHLPPDMVMYYLERAYSQLTYPRHLEERQEWIRRIGFAKYQVNPNNNDD